MTKSASISTLSEFLLQAQTQHMVFDMGRGIRKIDNQTFFEWENQQAPCAFPRLDHAWFCIVFWNEKLSDERYIWFVKLPLDENGLMMSAPLHQFLEIITQALGKGLEHTQNEQAQLPENPFVFVPSQQQLADCNAHIRAALRVNPRDNSKVSIYIQTPTLLADEDGWANFSVQDIADFVIQECQASSHELQTQSNHSSNQATIASNMSAYAPAVQNCLFASLESIEVEKTLVEALIAFHQSNSEPAITALCLRAMSNKPHDLCFDYLSTLIAGAQNNNGIVRSDKLDIETCVVIVGRYWPLFNKPGLLASFMHQVVLLDPSFDLFKGLYIDLVKVPEIRATMLKFIRDPERSNEVSVAIGALFSSH